MQGMRATEEFEESKLVIHAKNEYPKSIYIVITHQNLAK